MTTVSESNGPVRRRRIAGESGPAAPARKAVPPRPAPRRPVARTAPATPKASPDARVTAAPSTPVTRGRAPAKPATPVAPRPAAPKVTAPKTKAIKATKATKATKDERPAGSRPSRRDLLWLVPATLVALAALVLGVLVMVDQVTGDDGDLDASRRQASSAAASAAETIFTFRHDQLDDHLAASKALMTPAFAKEFDKIAPALTELAPQRSIVVQAVARESAVLPCGDECSSTKADVLVFVDQARLIGDSKEPTVFANRIKVSMVKQDDGWLVANVRAL
ncbi:hypothetical protein [Aeromicrobium wangtongii]|uniref:hypothetical protein n=1 Tax=Aeromicrobium wangtongii TaxID=2969247 RepID=UPI0020170E14|nr:hypothetical protein [Aeromicrobium wangtongii]MCL3819677.1 hypothetical protein [Aeromicrobium wangtongii]